MALRYPNRGQMDLFPPRIEEYVPQDAPVRFYDAFIDQIDLDEIGIDVDPHKVGSPAYDPKTMLKLLVYAYSYGVRSSRKIEREIHNNLSFIWLMGGLKPDHWTICDFRRRNKKALKNVLRQTVKLAAKLELIGGNVLFVDGTKINADASIGNHWDEKRLAKLDRHIEHLLEEIESIDAEESEHGSLARLQEKLDSKQKIRDEVQKALEEMKKNDRTSVNLTDPDAGKIKSPRATGAGYNAQSTVDDKHGLIVNADVVYDNTDYDQLSDQIEQANETLDAVLEQESIDEEDEEKETRPQVAVADCGYHNIENMNRLVEQGIQVVVPTSRQTTKKTPGEFDVQHFTYHADGDYFVCPTGETIPFVRCEAQAKRKVYVGSKATCHKCPHYGKCTKSKVHGRKVTRLLNEEDRLAFESIYQEEENQKIYARRKCRAELPFGHIKHNLNFRQFGLRGLDGVRAEFSLLATSFNMTRILTIFGIDSVLAFLRLGDKSKAVLQ